MIKRKNRVVDKEKKEDRMRTVEGGMLRQCAISYLSCLDLILIECKRTKIRGQNNLHAVHKVDPKTKPKKDAS